MTLPAINPMRSSDQRQGGTHDNNIRKQHPRKAETETKNEGIHVTLKGVPTMKIILIIGDGMSDRPTRLLNGKTPLQVAEKPAMDTLARRGVCGIVDPISPGIPPGSDTAHLALLGYDPLRAYSGRGALEASGNGLDVRESDVSFRVNFATIDDDHIVVDRRAGRIGKGGQELSRALNGLKLEQYPDVQVIFTHSIEHRAALILRGRNLSRMVTDSDPHEEKHPIQTVKPLNTSAQAARTAHIVNELSERFHEILQNHPINVERVSKGLPPANAVLFRGAGTLPRIRSITEKYGVKALAVAAGALYKGVCAAAGFDVINVPGATGTYATDTVAKAKAVVENLPSYDYILVHVKGTDNASHDGDAAQKVRMVEKIDALVEYILRNVELEEVIVALTADHTSSLDLKEHVGDPVPVAIMGPWVRRDAVDRYTEVDCARGGLGRIRGVDLTPILIDLAGKSKKFGS